MPTFKSFGEFGKELDKVVADMEREARSRITRKMGERAKAIADSAAGAELPGMKFRHWPPKLETQLKDGREGATILMPTKTGAGPWTVLDQGRHQNDFAGPGINRRTGRTARTKSGGVRSAKGKRWNGRTVGKHTAAKAVARMERELPKIAEDGVRKLLQRHFDVT